MEQLFSNIFPIALTVGLAGTLLRLAVIDLKTFRLPDAYTLPLVAAGLTLGGVFDDPAPVARLIGAAAGFAILALIGELHFRRSGTEGLGLGDAKLFAAAGAWLGWQALPLVLLIAAVTGLVYAVAKGGGRAAPIAFGPMLALGFWLCWAGQMLTRLG